MSKKFKNQISVDNNEMNVIVGKSSKCMWEDQLCKEIECLFLRDEVLCTRYQCTWSGINLRCYN